MPTFLLALPLSGKVLQAERKLVRNARKRKFLLMPSQCFTIFQRFFHF